MPENMLDLSKAAFAAAMEGFDPEFQWDIVHAVQPTPEGPQFVAWVVMTLPSPAIGAKDRLLVNMALPALWILHEPDNCRQIVTDMALHLRKQRQDWLAGKS